jgi:hypothetical protein
VIVMPEVVANGGGGNKASQLQGLKDLNWPTLILILFSGGANLLTTQKNSSAREYQIDQAVSQIRELHGALDDFEKRQKQSLENTNQLLEHDSVLLKEVHAISLNLQSSHRNEEMRGAPQ